MTTRMSWPSAASAFGSAPTTSPRPPVFAKGATSAEIVSMRSGGMDRRFYPRLRGILRRRGNRLSSLLELGVDHLGERGKRLSAVQEVSVDEERRSPGDAELSRLRDVRLDLRLELRVVHRLGELRDIEIQILRVLDEVVTRELLLVGEELVVVLPELPLLVRGHGGQRRRHRVLMERQRHVLPDDPDRIAV